MQQHENALKTKRNQVILTKVNSEQKIMLKLGNALKTKRNHVILDDPESYQGMWETLVKQSEIKRFCMLRPRDRTI